MVVLLALLSLPPSGCRCCFWRRFLGSSCNPCQENNTLINKTKEIEKILPDKHFFTITPSSILSQMIKLIFTLNFRIHLLFVSLNYILSEVLRLHNSQFLSMQTTLSKAGTIHPFYIPFMSFTILLFIYIPLSSRKVFPRPLS